MMFSFKIPQQTQCYKQLLSIITIAKNENFKAAPYKFFFFLDSPKFLGLKKQDNLIHPLESKIDGFLKLQKPKNKKNAKLRRISYVHFKIYL